MTTDVGGGRVAERKMVTAKGVTESEDGGAWTVQEIADPMGDVPLPESAAPGEARRGRTGFSRTAGTGRLSVRPALAEPRRCSRGARGWELVEGRR